MVTTALLLSPLLYYINLFKLLSCFLNGLNPFSYSAPHPTGQGGDFEQEATWHLVGKCSLTKSSYAYATTFNSVTEWTVCAKGNVETINQGLTLVLQVLDKDQTFRQEDLRTLFLLCFFFWRTDLFDWFLFGLYQFFLCLIWNVFNKCRSYFNQCRIGLSMQLLSI